MSVTVGRTCTGVEIEDQYVGRPARASATSLVVAAGAHHLLGHCLGGLRAATMCEGDSAETDIEAHLYVYRHPNCRAIDVRLKVQETIDQDFKISAKAGSGAWVIVYLPDPGGDTTRWICLRCAWGVGDSGWCPVDVATEHCGIAALVVHDVPRKRLALDDGDHCVEVMHGGAYPAIGLGADLAITVSDRAGTEALIEGLRDAWDDYHPQAVSWWRPESAAKSTALGVWTDLLTVTLHHLAREQRTTDTARHYVARVRTWMDGVGSYRWRITSANPGAAPDETLSSGNIVNTAAAWQAALSPLHVDCTADATLTIEVILDAGGPVYISAVSVGEL